jgi:hypothetical protein
MKGSSSSTSASSRRPERGDLRYLPGRSLRPRLRLPELTVWPSIPKPTRRAAIGKLTVMVVPTPSQLSTEIEPA